MRGPNKQSKTSSPLRRVHLVDCDTGCQAWPPQQSSVAVAFAATSMVPAYNPADWHNDDRRAKAQQQQRQHMADYYARTTREQEERENSEARERFAESHWVFSAASLIYRKMTANADTRLRAKFCSDTAERGGKVRCRDAVENEFRHLNAKNRSRA